MYIDVKNYIREKNGLYYAVMVYTNVRGERKEKWFSTKLPVKFNNTKLEAFSKKFYFINERILDLYMCTGEFLRKINRKNKKMYFF